MSVNEPALGTEPRSEQTMLRLSLRGRTGCRWVPLLILCLLVAAAAVWASYWFASRSSAAVPAPTASEALAPRRIGEAAEAATATPRAQPTAGPTAFHTPTLLPTVPASPTPVPTRTREPLPTLTPTAQATAIPAAIPTATLIPTPTLTPPAPPTSAAATPTPSACDASLVATIERAAEAQAGYMEGELDASVLAEAWGGAAADARAQAERMMAYRAGGIAGVDVTKVEWAVGNCRARTYNGWVQVTVSEEWRYTAQLTCASGAVETSIWAEVFASETYALVPDSGGWRIQSWLIGAPNAETRWRCSANQ